MWENLVTYAKNQCLFTNSASRGIPWNSSRVIGCLYLDT